MAATKKVIFPGSFDPLTNGHVDILHCSLEIFDNVLVGVLTNPSKKYLFSAKERISMINEVFQDHPGIEIKQFSGLLVDFAKKNKANVIIRGLRAISDYDYEAQMALVNRRLSSEVETLFMVAREENSYISSTLVKQIAPFSGNLSEMVPSLVAKALTKKYNKKK